MKSVYIPKRKIDETLATEPTQGKHLLEPLKSLAAAMNLPFKVLEDMDVVTEAEVHLHEDDVWFCLEGEVRFVCGGALTDPYPVIKDGVTNSNELKAKEISGGEEIILTPGDWLWIPAGEAHRHSSVGPARLMIIKIPRGKN